MIRKLSFLFFLALSVYNVHAQKNTVSKKITEPKGTVFFDHTVFNFGLIEEMNGKVVCYFTFKNIGRGNVTVQSVESGCGCTVPEWPHDPIKPGEQGKIKAEFDPEGKFGPFSKTLTVKTNGDPSVMFLTLNGEVYRESMEVRSTFPFIQGHLRFTKYSLNMKPILESGSDSVVFTVFNTSKRELIISKIVTPPHIRSKVYQNIITPGNVTDIIYYFDAYKANDLGPRTDETFIYTTDDTLPKKFVTLKTTILQDFSLLSPEQQTHPAKIVWKEPTFDFGEVYLGETVSHEFLFTNKGKSDLIIRKADPSCGCTVTNFSREPIKKGKSGKIRVTFNAGNLRGNQDKIVTVYANDPQSATTTLRIKAKVVIPGVDPISGK